MSPLTPEVDASFYIPIAVAGRSGSLNRWFGCLNRRMSEWNEPPDRDTYAFFEKAISGHGHVQGMEQVEPQVYELSREGMADVRVWICNVYRVSAADVAEICAEDPDVDAIVTMSAWNDVTAEGKQAGKEQGVGVFAFKQLMGALNYEHEEFTDYKPPDRDKRLGRRGARSG